METTKTLLTVTKDHEGIGAQLSTNPIESIEAIGHTCLTYLSMTNNAGLTPKESVQALFSSIGIFTHIADSKIDEEDRELLYELRNAVDAYLKKEE